MTFPDFYTNYEIHIKARPGFKVVDNPNSCYVLYTFESPDLAEIRARFHGLPGIYILMLKDGSCYVGQSNNLVNRLISHLSDKRVEQFCVFTVNAKNKANNLQSLLNYLEEQLILLLKDTNHRITNKKNGNKAFSTNRHVFLELTTCLKHAGVVLSKTREGQRLITEVPRPSDADTENKAKAILTNNSHAACLSAIFKTELKIVGEDGDSRVLSVIDLVKEITDNKSNYSWALGVKGLQVLKGQLRVAQSADHPEVRKIFQDSQFANGEWSSVLKSIPGARANLCLKLCGKSARMIAIPLDSAFKIIGETVYS